MNRFWIRLLVLSIALVAVPLPASSNPPVWKRLKDNYPKTEEYLTGRGGAARTYVKAPLQEAVATVTDYDAYERMISRFKEARVVARHGEKTDVFVRVPIMNGTTEVWATVRVDPPVQVSKDEYVIYGRMVEGNVRDFNLVYRLSRADDDGTQLAMEMVIIPRFPVPRALVKREVSGAASNAVVRFRRHSERRYQAHKK